MKNQLLYLLLSCCFLLGSIGNINANHTGLDGGIVLIVHNCKTGSTLPFSVPDSYFNKEGSLTAPLEITLSQGGSPAFSTITKDVSIELPTNLKGTYEVQIKIGSHSTSEKITI